MSAQAVSGWVCLWPRCLLNDASDEVYRKEPNEKRGEPAAEVGENGALAARQGCNGLPGNLRRGLYTARFEDAGSGYVEEFAFRGAGAERGDFDAEARDLGGQSESEEAVEDLGGGVGGDVRDGLKAGCRSDNENPPAAALDHAWHKQAREPDDGLAVDADLAQFLLDGALIEGAELAEPGVVDQDVDGQTLALGVVVNLLWGGWIVEVGDNDADFSSFRRKLGGQGFQTVAAATRSAAVPS